MNRSFLFSLSAPVMCNEQPKHPSDADADLEREIRKERKFSLADAIGRLAGPGMMKGVSPVARKQQSEMEIEAYLERHLIDAAAILPAVLLRRVKGSELLLNNFDQPLFVLASYIQRVLDSEYLLKELVREADIEWGRTLGERPYFEKDGCPPHPDDPYTIESVRVILSRLMWVAGNFPTTMAMKTTLSIPSTISRPVRVASATALSTVKSSDTRHLLSQPPSAFLARKTQAASHRDRKSGLGTAASPGRDLAPSGFQSTSQQPM
jgi:hypothetical protein